MSGRFPADSVVDRGAQAVEVCGGSQRASADLLLGSRVAYIDRLPDNVIFHTAAKIRSVAPVNEVYAAIPAQKTVDRADVAMNIAAAVDRLQDFQRTLHDIERKSKGHTSAEAVHIFFTGHAFKIFLDEVEGIIFLKCVEAAGNTGDAAEQIQHLCLSAHLHQAPGQLFLA